MVAERRTPHGAGTCLSYNSRRPCYVLAALLCRHPVQRYAATSGVTLHSYPATHFG
jgi:hypothetical protein